MVWIAIVGLVLMILGLILPSSTDPLGGFVVVMGMLVATMGGAGGEA